MLIVLLAMCAFVLDVLSPITPTPNAQAAKSLAIALLSISFVASCGRILHRCAGQTISLQLDASATKPGSRTLIALICSLLC